MARRTDAQNRIERLQVETTVGQYFFQDLYNREVYFEDFDDKSSNYLKLDYDPSFIFNAGRNLIGIKVMLKQWRLTLKYLLRLSIKMDSY